MVAVGLSQNIKAYEAMQAQLEADCLGRWVIFYNAKLIDDFESFDVAAVAAVEKFQRGPYLIRQVGAPPARLSPSLLFRTL